MLLWFILHTLSPRRCECNGLPIDSDVPSLCDMPSYCTFSLRLRYLFHNILKFEIPLENLKALGKVNKYRHIFNIFPHKIISTEGYFQYCQNSLEIEKFSRTALGSFFSNLRILIIKFPK